MVAVGERSVVTVIRTIAGSAMVRKEMSRIRDRWFHAEMEDWAVIRFAGCNIVLQPAEWNDWSYIGATWLFLLPGAAVWWDVVLDRATGQLFQVELPDADDQEGSAAMSEFNKWAFHVLARLNGLDEVRVRRPSPRQQREALERAEGILPRLPFY
ncbi:MAG TPA: hypothetical protein PLO65_00105 [Caulobacter sp.]|nr:hypothetical protein [Caulobacter sp.]